MSFESVIYETLSQDLELQTLLTPQGSTIMQLFPQQPKDNAFWPWAWYGFARQDKLVFGAVATGISNYSFEINCFSKTYQGVLGIANRVIALLNNLVSAPDVGLCRLDDEAMKERADGYIYYVKSLKFKGMGV